MVHVPVKKHPLDPKVRPWERQPKEPDKAFVAFTKYRDQPTDERSVRAVARDLKVHDTQTHRWSAGWAWLERAAAWDRHLDAIAQKEREKQIKDMTRRHAGLANAGLGVLQEPIKELIRRIEAKELNLAGMNTGDLLRLVRQSAQAIKDLCGVERVARGVPETVVGGVLGQASSPATVAAMVQALFDEAPMVEAGQHAEALAGLLAKPPESVPQTPA